MTFKSWPVKFEIVDEEDELRAVVSTIDDAAVEVLLHGSVGLAEWRELAALIEAAIEAMELTA